MKPEEFRLGIWVCWEGRDIIIEEGYLEVLFASRNYEDYRPIPLTEEWLLRFGFEDNSYAVFYKQFNEYESFKISFKDYAHTELVEHPVEVSDYNLPIKCIYVHQLQNLWHALTGEELLTNPNNEPSTERD